MKYEITTEDKVREIEKYIEGLRDDDGVLYLNSEVESLLNDALKIIKGLRYGLEKRQNAIDYVLTAKPIHYHYTNNMLEDFKYVIKATLEGK